MPTTPPPSIGQRHLTLISVPQELRGTMPMTCVPLEVSLQAVFLASLSRKWLLLRWGNVDLSTVTIIMVSLQTTVVWTRKRQQRFRVGGGEQGWARLLLLSDTWALINEWAEFWSDQNMQMSLQILTGQTAKTCMLQHVSKHMFPSWSENMFRS